MSKLFSYFQSPTIDSEQQLRDAQVKASQYTATQNAHARAAGFHNADEMYLFLKNRQAKPLTSSASASSPDLSFSDLFSWHPANTLGIATDALKQATER